MEALARLERRRPGGDHVRDPVRLRRDNTDRRNGRGIRARCPSGAGGPWERRNGEGRWIRNRSRHPGRDPVRQPVDLRIHRGDRPGLGGVDRGHPRGAGGGKPVRAGAPPSHRINNVVRKVLPAGITCRQFCFSILSLQRSTRESAWRWHMTTETRTLRVIEPATEKLMAELHEATIEQADAAVARAQAPYPPWQALSPNYRGNLLRRIASMVEKHLEELAQLESRNVGKPISDARGEVGMVVDVFHYYAGAPERLAGKTIPVAGGVDMTFREPLGVVALIVPWNFPLAISSWKVAPALAAGNTIVL